MRATARIGCVITTALLLLAVTVPVAGATSYGGGSIQPYDAKRSIDIGTIVALTGEQSKRVMPATEKDAANMFGVTVDRNILPITYSHEQMAHPTYVAVSGTYNTLVSTQNGPIKTGDYVTLSSVDGVAMKAGTKKTTVFGRAYASFDGTGPVLGSVQLKDTTGKQYKTVKLGMVPVTIDIKHNPNIKTTKVDVPDFLQRVGQQIAEKEVSPIRIYLSMAISAVSLIMAIAVLYTGIRSSVISIGRNPMSKKSIFRALMEVILTSLLILIIGLFAVYLLLKL